MYVSSEESGMALVHQPFVSDSLILHHHYQTLCVVVYPHPTKGLPLRKKTMYIGKLYKNARKTSPQEMLFSAGRGVNHDPFMQDENQLFSLRLEKNRTIN